MDACDGQMTARRSGHRSMRSSITIRMGAVDADGSLMTGSAGRPGRFGRRQIAELPPISVIWTEHRTHQLRCRHCRARTSARLPEQISSWVFGPRLQAAIVTLTARHRISRRAIGELARDLFGVTLSTGAVDAICQRASDALAGPHCQLQDWVLDQGSVHVDETGWRTRGERRALWTATTPGAAFFQIAEHCNREQLGALVGTSYPGIVVSDRWNGYEHLDPTRRQVCWSHIQRDFRRHSEGLAEQKTFGEQGLELTHEVFKAWRAYQHEHHDRQRLKAEIAPIQTELRALLQDASPKTRHPAGTDGSRTTCSRSGRLAHQRAPPGPLFPSACRRRQSPRSGELYYGFASYVARGSGWTSGPVPAALGGGRSRSGPGRDGQRASDASAMRRDGRSSQTCLQPPRVRRLSPPALMTSTIPARRIGTAPTPVKGRLLRVSAWLSASSTDVVDLACGDTWSSRDGVA
jgi:hypothetical protein